MFEDLFKKYLNGFHLVGEPYLKTIANCPVPSRIVRFQYKKLPPIKSLSYSEKKELWLYAKEVYPDETKTFRVHFMQIVYTIGNYL